MGIGTTELMIILAIIILLFGAKKIPDLAAGFGKGIKSFKKAMNEDEDGTTVKVEDKTPVQTATPTQTPTQATAQTATPTQATHTQHTDTNHTPKA